MITRDTLIREHRARGASWPAVVIVYALIIAAMVFSGLAIT